jgi:glutamine synthetase
MFNTLDCDLSTDVFKHYMTLPQDDNVVLAEYVWIGGSGSDLRCKTRTLVNQEIKSVNDLPVWNYDGSSTGQAPGKDSEVYLKPVRIFRDPFRRGNNILVLCESCLPDGKLTPIPTNTRNACAKLMEQAKDHIPWFGIEQEYTLFHQDMTTPFGWPKNGFPRPQGPFYCSAGAENAFGRRVVESHYSACLYAGVTIAGVNAEVMPGQWEYQVGPCEGITSGDELQMSRYIMMRVCEDYGLVVSFDPKPIPGDWNGAGCHTNYSTESMRNEGGYEHIITAIEKLGRKHQEHIAVYGTGNERRLTGAHETAPIDKFSYGVAHRGASVRIPRQAKLEGKGYFEDRRPASNMDPYVVTGKIVKTTLID